MTLHFKLGDVLDEIKITKNALAVEAKVRPATVASYVKGEVGRIEVPTLVSMLNVINRIAAEKGVNRSYGIEDIISYTYEGAE